MKLSNLARRALVINSCMKNTRVWGGKAAFLVAPSVALDFALYNFPVVELDPWQRGVLSGGVGVAFGLPFAMTPSTLRPVWGRMGVGALVGGTLGLLLGLTEKK